MKFSSYPTIYSLHILHLILCLSLLDDFGIVVKVEPLGINYGQVGNNLPPPGTVLSLIRSMRITKVRIYDTNPDVLKAFANSGVELIVTVENDMLSTLADPRQALQWVNARVRPYYPATKITAIAVGNEVFTDDDTSLTAYVVPAMAGVHAALVQLGLASFIQVSSPTSLAVLASSYPPSAGAFKPELTAVMTQFLAFLQATRSPFWVNAYPYFAYKDNPSQISLDYVLGNPGPNNPGTIDPHTNLRYDNMLYAQVDAAVYAASRLGYPNLDVRVSETGWPSKGDPDEVGATPGNAATYNRNILRRQVAGQGTPLRPNARLEVYLFALFNEDMKPGPTSERNYGLFRPDCTMAYNVGISTLSNPSSAISLTSSATSKATNNMGYRGLVCWILVWILALPLLRSPT